MHRDPSFIGAVLNLKPAAARVYIPPDANCFLSTVAHYLCAKNHVNLMVGSKQPTPVWLSPEEATNVHCVVGASVWRFTSTDEGLNPGVYVNLHNIVLYGTNNATQRLRIARLVRIPQYCQCLNRL